MRDQPLAKPVRVRVSTVMADEWTESAACLGVTATEMLCTECSVRSECEALYLTLCETLEDPTLLTGVWGGKNRGREMGARRGPGGHRYPKGSKPVNGEVCTFPLCDKNAYRKGMCNPHYRRELRAQEYSA